MQIVRNNLCYCASGKKYKKCHLYIEQGYSYDSENNYWEKNKVSLPENINPAIVGPVTEHKKTFDIKGKEKTILDTESESSIGMDFSEYKK